MSTATELTKQQVKRNKARRARAVKSRRRDYMRPIKKQHIGRQRHWFDAEGNALLGRTEQAAWLIEHPTFPPARHERANQYRVIDGELELWGTVATTCDHDGEELLT